MLDGNILKWNEHLTAVRKNTKRRQKTNKTNVCFFSANKRAKSLIYRTGRTVPSFRQSIGRRLGNAALSLQNHLKLILKFIIWSVIELKLMLIKILIIYRTIPFNYSDLIDLMQWLYQSLKNHWKSSEMSLEIDYMIRDWIKVDAN